LKKPEKTSEAKAKYILRGRPGQRPVLFIKEGMVILLILMVLTLSCQKKRTGSSSDLETVGVKENGKTVLPVNQQLRPYGSYLVLPGVRPQALAISPDGKLVVVSGKSSELLALDPLELKILQRVAFPSTEQQEPQAVLSSTNILNSEEKGQLSYTGLIFSPDGCRIFLSDVEGSIKVFSLNEDGIIKLSKTIILPPAGAPRRKKEIPAGLALSPDAKKLYVCGNLSNRLIEINPDTGEVLRLFEVGVAPFDVVLKGEKAYVSNWGGRRPAPGDLVGPAGRGTKVKVDPEKFIASEGSISVVNLKTGLVIKEIVVGLHSSALVLSPDGNYLVCANAASDNLSLIDTRSDRVVETIWVKRSPADLFGASPNALSFTPDGKKLLVANGTQNAVAVVEFKPDKKKSQVKGMVPVGWFPGALGWHKQQSKLWVANIKGIADRPRTDDKTGQTGFNTHQYYGSISVFSLPGNKDLKKLTNCVFENFHRNRIKESLKRPRQGQRPKPIPERIGEPSLIKHVVYIIKENRTYDQVLGDVPEGNGNPALCIFGKEVTPNQHKLVKEFVLLDNTYCSGILSADGHQWSTTAFGTDYLERSFAGWPRSYPDGMGEDEVDALAYAPSGFIWDNCRRHCVSIWNFGEFAIPELRWKDPKREGKPGWMDFWEEYLEGNGEVIIASRPGIPSIADFTPTNYVGWSMEVPDVWRARYIKNQIKKWEEGGEMPSMVLICLPIDHTSGTKAGYPTPRAAVADNDLALGQIIEALSHSRFWKEMLVMAIEDDPQNGFDHVSGYRTTAYLAGPYVKRGQVIHTQYNTTSLLRTIEQILGLPPMNQFDATATPMFDCFTDQPDFRPYTVIANQIPLDELNPEPEEIADALLRKNAQTSARLNFKRVDACPEDVLNRIIWHSVKGSEAPYPSWAVTLIQDRD